MPSPLRFAFGLAALFSVSAAAPAQCGDWQSLGPLSSCGYVGIPSFFAADEASHEFYAASQGFCGYHGGTTPDVHRLSGTGWGASMVSFDEGAGSGLAFFDDGAGPALYLWGTQQSPPAPAQPFMKLTPGGWTDVPNPVGYPTAVTVFDDGAGRKFYFAGSDGSIVRVGNGVTQSLGFAVPANSVTQFVEHDDGSGPALYAVGSFTSIGGVAANRIARWDGAAWHPLGVGISPATSTYYTALRARSVAHGPLLGLYVGGEFASAGGVAANGIARWEGGAWQGLGAGIPGTVQALGGFEWFDEGRGSGPRLVASGITSSLRFLLAWDGTSWSSMSGGIVPAGGPIAVFDRPETTGTDLVVCGLVFPLPAFPTYSEIHAFSLEACSLTGELTCLGDGSFAACPCGNESAVGDRVGCLHSQGIGASLRARGTPRLSNDTLVLDGSAMPNSSVLYFQGANASTPVVFGDGVKCTGGPFVRLGNKSNSGGASAYPAPGDLPVSARGQIAAPGTRWYQARYRNAAAFCTSATFNYTNGVEISWIP